MKGGYCDPAGVPSCHLIGGCVSGCGNQPPSHLLELGVGIV